VESNEVVGDIGFGKNSEAMGDVLVIVELVSVAALSIRQWNVSLVPLRESMFRRMKGVKRDIRVGQRGHGWLYIGSMVGGSNRLAAVMLIEEHRHRQFTKSRFI
jgi:hypothetical protein